MLRLRTAALIAVLLVFFHFSAMGAALEVVQSVPVETQLTVPGIPQTQQVWVSMISSAKKTIDLEQFYISHRSKESLEPVLNALIDAAKRGVKIRFLIDVQFFKNYPQVPQALDQIDHIEVRTISYASLGGIQHSKFFVVDGVNSFLGSANFDWLALSHIHEVGLQIQDSQVGENLLSVFEQDWAWGKPVSNSLSLNDGGRTRGGPGTGGGGNKKNTPLQILASPPQRLPQQILSSLEQLLQLMGSAKKSIQIQVYQYSTKGKPGRWTVLDDSIRKAAARGVKVKLLVDSVAMKNSSAELASLATVQNIEVKTVKIPEWSGGPLSYARLVHSKYMTVDGTISWVGTENWSQNYFQGCRNVGVIVRSSETTEKLNQIFDRVWESPYTTSLKPAL